MTTDRYTKFILTVIAVALIGHFFKDAPIVSTANAQERRTVTDVNIVAIAGQPAELDTLGKPQGWLPVGDVFRK